MAKGDTVEREGNTLSRDSEGSTDAWVELRRSLDDLAQLPTGHTGLKQTLTSVAELAVRAIPGAEGAGLTLLEKDRPDTIVSTADFVTAVDRIQYGLGQGPCISAAAEGLTIHSDELGVDSRWPMFGTQAAALNVHSALSLPLITPNSVVGSMNIYAHTTRAFTEQSVELGQLFAHPAAIAVHTAQILAQAQRLAANLRQALNGRSTLDQAIGIMMARSGSSADEAMSRLRALSSAQHQAIKVVAQSIVDQAVRAARAGSAAE